MTAVVASLCILLIQTHTRIHTLTHTQSMQAAENEVNLDVTVIDDFDWDYSARESEELHDNAQARATLEKYIRKTKINTIGECIHVLMCVCAYAGVCVGRYVYGPAREDQHTPTHTHAYAHTHRHTHTPIQTHTHTYIHTHSASQRKQEAFLC